MIGSRYYLHLCEDLLHLCEVRLRRSVTDIENRLVVPKGGGAGGGGGVGVWD